MNYSRIAKKKKRLYMMFSAWSGVRHCQGLGFSESDAETNAYMKEDSWRASLGNHTFWKLKKQMEKLVY